MRSFIWLLILGLSTAFADGINVPSPSFVSLPWTPAITTDATVGTPSYAVQVGSYESIGAAATGRQITARFYLQLNGWTGSPTGNIKIANFPVAVTSTANDLGQCVITGYVVAGLAASNWGVTGVMLASATEAIIVSSNVTGTGQVTAAQFGTIGTIRGFCTYHN